MHLVLNNFWKFIRSEASLPPQDFSALHRMWLGIELDFKGFSLALIVQYDQWSVWNYILCRLGWIDVAGWFHFDNFQRPFHRIKRLARSLKAAQPMRSTVKSRGPDQPWHGGRWRNILDICHLRAAWQKCEIQLTTKWRWIDRFWHQQNDTSCK